MIMPLSSFACALVVFSGVGISTQAADMPTWILPGLLARESSSYYDGDGSIVYVDQRMGKDGERGPFQMRPAAFADIAEPGERFETLSTDMRFAEICARRYLALLYSRFAGRDWFYAVGRWNVGPHGDLSTAWDYAKKVQRLGLITVRYSQPADKNASENAVVK